MKKIAFIVLFFLVCRESRADLLEEAKSLFTPLKTIEFLVRENQLHLVGEVETLADFKRVEDFCAHYPNNVVNEVVVAQAVLNTLSHLIQSALQTPGVKVRAVRNQIVLEGVAFSESSAKKAQEIAKLYFPQILNLIEVRNQNRFVGKEKMVELSLYFMEIQKSALRTFGIQWAPGALSDSGIKSLLGFVLNLAPKLRFIRESGLGRVLENPTLLIKSGESGDFFSGVQIPYYSKENVQFKEVGVKLSAEPIAIGDDIDLKINLTVASPSAHIQGGIQTHTLATSAYIPAGQAAVLGGLLSNQSVKTYNRTPPEIANSTPLFNLFLSKDFQSSSSELVVFVLPKIIDQTVNAKKEEENFKEMEEKMIRERSLKEYKEFLKKRKRKNRDE